MKKPQRVFRLTTHRAIRMEAARVFREARRGELDSTEAGQLLKLLLGVDKVLAAELEEKRRTEPDDWTNAAEAWAARGEVQHG